MEEMIKCPNCGVENKSTDSFCSECGGNLKEKQKKENAIVSGIWDLFDIITFIISACIVSLVFVIPIFIAILGISDSINGDNIWQQTYYAIHTSSIIIGIGIGVVAGFVVTAFSRNNAKLKRIEKSINEIQQKLQ